MARFLSSSLSIEPPAMQASTTIDDVLRTVPRFRILCVGRSGVGKSSLIKKVFGVDTVDIAEYRPGEADINQEHVSNQNKYFVLHDSKGYEPGETANFDVVREFILQRCAEPELKDRLHAIWLCVETPTAGGRVMEAGDEKLLALASEKEVPVVVVFTNYDLLERSKEYNLKQKKPSLPREELASLSKEDARVEFARHIDLLHSTLSLLGINSRHFTKVSIRPGYQQELEFLVEMTRDIVRDKLDGDAYIMWAIAQRVNLKLKLDESVDGAVNYFKYAMTGSVPGVGKILLRDCLSRMHRDIVLCWNFEDKSQILVSSEFKQLILYLLQDIVDGPKSPTPLQFDKVSQFVTLVTGASAAIAPPVAILGLAYVFINWLSDAVLESVPNVERTVLAYTVDLIHVLKSLFDFKLVQRLSGNTDWEMVRESFESYERSGDLRAVHESCRFVEAEDGAKIMGVDGFERNVKELLLK